MFTPFYKKLIVAFLFLSFSLQSFSQQLSPARVWNEMVLIAIRNDNARPVVHARNLFHTSLAMYDAWAAYDDVNDTYFLGKTVGNYFCPFNGVPTPSNLDEARTEALSYAVYRLIKHRFEDSPGEDLINLNTDLIFGAFGYDPAYTDIDYENGNPAALGNYIGQQIITLGLIDGSNESNGYKNQYYEPINPNLNPTFGYYDPVAMFGNPRINDPNRWQALDIPGFVDQAGNPITDGSNLEFLGAEWGNVIPFAMTPDMATTLQRDGDDYKVYLDPGAPYLLDTLNGGGTSDLYKWGFSLVASWKSHILNDGVMIDISPNSIGNNPPLPTTDQGIQDFYNFMDGGDSSQGYTTNPKTGQPYPVQNVARRDYARVLAEFWADGPNSETPPGHWFTILNYVNDHPDLIKKYQGQGFTMSNLEWDVKAYLAMGGAMHDAAISAWSVKGYYDYIRPISALRYMMDKGQSTDPSGSHYSPNGMPLIPGVIDTIGVGDPLLSVDGSNMGTVKFLSFTFDGNDFWTQGTLWTPYQLATFVTPPFAGYVSGHSTFSRAAAEVLTRFTGDEYFPGGLGEFFAEKAFYLEFEPGPTEDVTLQWARYVDAADQSGLSRIWGGIHPPIDDIPGRIMGIEVGNTAFDLADSLFGDVVPVAVKNLKVKQKQILIFPNPYKNGSDLPMQIRFSEIQNSPLSLELFTLNGQSIFQKNMMPNGNVVSLNLGDADLVSGVYYLKLKGEDFEVNKKVVIID